MLLGKKEFLAGVLVAALAGIAAFEPLSALASAKVSLTPEIVFSQQLGLFRELKPGSKALNASISESDFQSALGRVLLETGLLKSSDSDELEANGIIGPEQPKRTISRQNACETILRTVMFAWIQNSLPRPEEITSSASFKDWQPDAKYSPALDYAILAGLIQGGSDGRFRPDDNLKVKEALWLLKRLYDLVLANGGERRFSMFSDVPQDHSMTRPLINLLNAGAFDLTNLGRKLNGNGNIRVRDLGLVLKGILARQEKSGHIAQIERIMQSSGARRPATRQTLANMAAILAQATPHSETNLHILYSDVAPGSSLARALEVLAKAGIRLGYNNNRFAGNEQVSRFEALGVINRIVSELEPESPKVETSRTATSADMEAFITRLRSKRERVHRILNRS
ncbi:MAG: hypothetical protein CVV41_13735 [Candidatus Riflebacteria bacterium HGW-Riflebacteria-1]|jgi:hypothetical protein|nr:MAG: hypothetical protein CVV41_13735 [Candidatus Riflebacteria bacterium HGW-Riflebacteria-1]